MYTYVIHAFHDLLYALFRLLLWMMATTDNYYTVALHDDDGAASHVVGDPSDTRAKRIAAAVERSKIEYQAQHVYTERGVSVSSS